MHHFHFLMSPTQCFGSGSVGRLDNIGRFYATSANFGVLLALTQEFLGHFQIILVPYLNLLQNYNLDLSTTLQDLVTSL